MFILAGRNGPAPSNRLSFLLVREKYAHQVLPVHVAAEVAEERVTRTFAFLSEKLPAGVAADWIDLIASAALKARF